MRVACIQYKSYEYEEKTLKKILPLIHIAAKKNVDLIIASYTCSFSICMYV